METKDILLIFNSCNSLKYWLHYVLSYLKENDIIFNCTYYSNQIIVKNRIIKFMIYDKDRIELYKKGRRNILEYHDVEYLFEKRFDDMMKEILNG